MDVRLATMDSHLVTKRIKLTDFCVIFAFEGFSILRIGRATVGISLAKRDKCPDGLRQANVTPPYIIYFTGLSGGFLLATADNPENAETEGASVAEMKITRKLQSH
jgi:hypothetical protein